VLFYSKNLEKLGAKIEKTRKKLDSETKQP